MHQSERHLSHERKSKTPEKERVFLSFSEQSQDFEVRDKPEFSDARLWRVAERAVQGSRSMKPRFRNANLLITHVLDMCVKLLVVSNITSAQGQSMDLSVSIITGRSRMMASSKLLVV